MAKAAAQKCYLCACRTAGMDVACRECFDGETKEYATENAVLHERVASLEESGVFVDPFDRTLDALRRGYLPNYV